MVALLDYENVYKVVVWIIKHTFNMKINPFYIVTRKNLAYT
ncbi:hypothetical protein THOM_2457 [Trachipleistophora hominis]|uniref:Uncharacterized protein n=1 Tax=Trachipleistophora hominis TaxID=72359 RepID=L7JSY8_TRAHO|nr:hypothetical protein THOM_2457 [Trachipleistophora hominis]